ncbi:SMC-Scp complex subunit ScpB [Candidatus Woesearchaeota archaeon]|nr:SMC-Scp complex subunit ScpB [Candidatus Woesearchaeota archaeon]
MDAKTKRVEAVLFAVGKEITTERIASLCSLPQEEIEQLMQQLVQEYAQREHSLQIVKKENGWKLTVRDEYVPLVSSLVSSTELDRPIMETLAVIAWKYPIVQSEIIKLRGPSAYEHMRRLEEQGFVDKEHQGRTFKVKLTKKFFEYFDLPSEEAKQAFLKQVPQEVLKEAEEVDKEADEVQRLQNQQQVRAETQREIKEAMEEVKKSENVPMENLESSEDVAPVKNIEKCVD